jgi:hypothetical protein
MAVENEPSIKVWVGEGDSPELLQKSGTVFFKTDKGEVRGFIWNDYATLSVQGTAARMGILVDEYFVGTLNHFSGGEIENYEGTYEEKIPIPSNTPIPVLMVWQGLKQFQGLIYFRGHDRKFGGGATIANLPSILKWRGKIPASYTELCAQIADLYYPK